MTKREFFQVERSLRNRLIRNAKLLSHFYSTPMGSKHRVRVGARAKTLLRFFSSHSRSNSLFDSIDDFIAFLLRLKLQNTTLVFFALAISSLNDHTPSGSLSLAIL